METTTIKVTGMSCGGCVASVTKVLTELPGVAKVDVRLTPGEATASDKSKVEILPDGSVRGSGTERALDYLVTGETALTPEQREALRQDLAG